MNALMTSFFRSHGLPPGFVPFSAAVYQPKGYSYVKAPWTDIRDANGNWIRPRNFLSAPDPLAAYHRALLDLYATRTGAIQTFLHSCEVERISPVFCCWCPKDRAAQRQLQEHGTFVCHTAVVGEVLEQFGVGVWYDDDRRRMKVLT